MPKKTDGEFFRIYDGSASHPLVTSMRAIVQAEAARTSEFNFGFDRPVADRLHFELMGDVQRLTDLFVEEYDAVFGPRIDLEAASSVSMDVGHIVVTCRDGDMLLEEEQPVRLTPWTVNDDWYQGALHRAATAYKRECGWDFTPGDAGTWLLYCLLTDGSGGKERMIYSANLVGFVILYDRDKDTAFESLGHIWTARAARKKGIGKRLVAEARRKFPLKTIEGPITELGTQLFNAAWPTHMEK